MGTVGLSSQLKCHEYGSGNGSNFVVVKQLIFAAMRWSCCSAIDHRDHFTGGEHNCAATSC